MKKHQSLRAVLTILAVLSAILLTIAGCAGPRRTTATVTPSVTPVSSVSSSTPLDGLSARVVQFETVYRGFDWSSPEKREQQLAGYFLPDTLSSVMQAEQQGTVREARLKSQTMQTVTSVGILTGEPDGDLAENIATVTIRKTQLGSEPFEYSIESKTSWVLDGDVWRVYAVDPL